MIETLSTTEINTLISCDHGGSLSLNQEFTPTTLGALVSLIANE